MKPKLWYISLPPGAETAGCLLICLFYSRQSPPPVRSPARFRYPWGADALGLLALLGFACAVAFPVFLGRVPVATDTLTLWGPLAGSGHQPVHNDVLADSALENLPAQVFVRRSLMHGEWPLWDPDLFAGYAFLGNVQNQLYYPVSWILWLLPLAAAIQTSVVLHLWLAGAGMYALARVLGASRTGSVRAGLAFAGSGQLYMAVELPVVADIYVWLPWVVAASERAWHERSARWTAGAALLFGVLILAGNPSWLLYSSLFLALWLGARVLVLAMATYGPRADGVPGIVARRHFWGQVARAGAILAGGPALAAIQLLPFIEKVQLSSRLTAGPPAAAPFAALPDLLGRQMRLFVPQFYGTSVGNIGEPLLFNNCWYVGLAPLALALGALALRRERRVLFLGAVGLSAWAVAAGLPLFRQLQQLPGLQAQVPERIAYLFIFCAAVLSGLGWDAWLTLARQHPVRAIALTTALGLLALPVIVALGTPHSPAQGTPDLYRLQTQALQQAGWIAGALLLWAGALVVLRGDRWQAGHATLAGGLLGLTVVDLLTYAPGYNTYVAPATLQPQAPVAGVLHADPGLWRMLAADTPLPMLVPNMATLFGLHDVQGYDSLPLAHYTTFWAASDPHAAPATYFNVMIRPQNYQSPLADLLNVQYVTTVAPINAIQQTDATSWVGELGRAPIGQSFLAPRQLTGIDIAFDTAGRVNHAPVILHIRRSIAAPQDLVQQIVDPAAWRGQPWISFTFPPLAVAKGDPLVVVLDSPQAQAGDAVGVRGSKRPRLRGGALFLGGHYQRRDLAFIARGVLPSKLARRYEGAGVVYTNRVALPRAFVVGTAEVLSPSGVLERLAQPTFDPRRAVLIEQPPPAGWPPPAGESLAPGSMTVTQYSNLSVTVVAPMQRAGWLVLSDVNYPGWTAEVDGQPAPLYTAYYILRAVPLPPGLHRVHFVFRPASVLVGSLVSGISLLLAWGGLALPWRGRHPWPKRRSW